jgi:hypothetical protein
MMTARLTGGGKVQLYDDCQTYWGRKGSVI